MATIKVKVVDDFGNEHIETWDLTRKVAPNFTLTELANVSAADEIKFISTPLSRTFIKMIQIMRSLEDEPWTVSSNYRTVAFNRSCGGDAKSCHLIGCALDRTNKNRTTADKQRQARRWKALCQIFGVVGAINYYTNGEHYEIGSDIQYGNKTFVIRDYRGKKGDW